MKAQILQAGEERVISLGPIRMTVLEDGANTRDTLGVAEFEVAPHAPTPPPHIHRAHEESFYVLEGEIEFIVGAERIRAGKGAFVLVPIGAPHTFANIGDGPARFLNTFTPPRYISYFDELSSLMSAHGVLNPAQVGELMAKYETEVVVARR